MRKTYIGLFLSFALLHLCGCAPLLVGAAVGGLGGYAISRDTIQGETDKSYDSLWRAAVTVGGIRGEIVQKDVLRGYLEVREGASRVKISLVRLTRATTRVKISARKYHFPDLNRAQDVFVKIMEQAK